MGLIKLSKKVKHDPVISHSYWAARDMHDFIPSVAYTVPVEGALSPNDPVIVRLVGMIAGAEQARCPESQVGVHIEVFSRLSCLTITIGVFAS